MQKNGFSVVILVFSLTLLVWGFWPFPLRSVKLIIPASEQPDGLGLPVPYVLTVEWPGRLRQGETGTVRLRFDAQDAENAASGVFLDYNVVAEARFEVNGVRVTPEGRVNQPLQPGSSAVFFWSLHPLKTGNYNGQAWCYLRFVPRDNGPESERAVAVLPVEFDVISLFGMAEDAARITGFICLIAGLLLSVSFRKSMMNVMGKD